MDSFNLIAGLCSILSFLLAAYDWSQRKRKARVIGQNVCPQSYAFPR